MRAREFIFEDIQKIDPTHEASLQNASTFPAMNSSTGSAYMNYRFGIALAGAPNFPMAAEPWIGGDPLLTTYTPEEMDMINYAAKQVGAGKANKWSGEKSLEVSDTNKTSPIPARKKNKYGV